MATSILIPNVSTGPFGQGYVGFVLEDQPASALPPTVIWQSPIARTDRRTAEHDAEDAVESIAYLRRKQLQLL